MKAIPGIFYDGTSAKATAATLQLDATGLVVSEPKLFPPINMAQLRIESRVGNIARHVFLPNGAVLASTDHDALDEWSAALHPRANLAHRLESRLAPAMTALVIVVVIMIGGAFWAVPHFAGYISEVFPQSWAVKLGAGTLEAMDDFMLEPSEIAAPEQERLTAMFITLLPESGPESPIMLRFRKAGIANAFALPDGSVVVTDELVSLLSDDVELAGVMLHEIGHVVHRHSLRMFISHAGLAGLTLTVFGDISAAGSLALGLPNVLMSNSYSRELEWEADSYALTALQRLDLPPASFAAALDHLETQFTQTGATSDSGGTPAGVCPTTVDVDLDDAAGSEPLPSETSSPPRKVGVDESSLPVTHAESMAKEKDPRTNEIEQLLKELPDEIVVERGDMPDDEVNAKMMDILRKELETDSKAAVKKSTDSPDQTPHVPQRRTPDGEEAAPKQQASARGKAALARRWMHYLSTHPPTEERKARFRDAAALP